MKTLNLNILLMLFVFIAFTGCKQDDISINTKDERRALSMGGPAVKISFSVKDVIEEIEEDFVKVNDEGLIYLYYKQAIFIDWQELVTLNNFEENWKVNPSDMLKSSAGDGFVGTVNLNHRPDVRYDSIFMNRGRLDVKIIAPQNSQGVINIKIPQIVGEDGNALVFVFNVTPENNTFSALSSLSAKTIYFSNDNNSEPYNSYVSIQMNANLEPVNIGEALDDIDLTFSISDMKQDMAHGNFGKQESSAMDAGMNFDAFDKMDVAENVEFKGMAFDVEVTNKIGVPFFVKSENVRFYQSEEEDAEVYPLTDNNGTETEISIDIDPALWGMPITPTLSRMMKPIDESTSNIQEIANKYPSRLVVDFYSFANPSNSGEGNFMGQDDKLQADLIINIPIWFRANLFSRKDTVDFDFPDMISGNDEEVDAFLNSAIYLDFFNKFPIDLIVKAWVIDADGNKIDDLLTEDKGRVKAGNPSSKDKAEETSFVVELTDVQVKAFRDKKAKEIIIETLATTYGINQDNYYVKIFDDISLQINIALDAKGRIPSF